MAIIDATQRLSSNLSYKRVLFTAFSPSENSEELALYNYLKAHGVDDISAFYWGGDKVKQAIPTDVNAVEISADGQFSPQLASGYDVVFRHTTTNPKTLVGLSTSSATRLFFERCTAPIIGVTGTKGKGTTATLIHEMLIAAGQTSHLLGNIGYPAISRLDDIKKTDVVVLELSSFQLWDIKQSPQVAIVLMVEPEHLDVHDSLEDYISAKANIARWQTSSDLIVYHPTNKLSAKVAAPGLGRHVKYLTPAEGHIQDGKLMYREQIICSVSDFGLIGSHNHENIAAALSAVWEFTQDVEAIAKAIKSFKGLEHRLEFVASKQGVEYYNDSFATTPGATIAAIKSFENKEVIILGGSDKGADYKQLADAIVGANVRRVLLIGATGPKIQAALNRAGFDNYEFVQGQMPDIVKTAASVAKRGDVVLLSPANASFDMFDNYKQRGRLFKQAVAKL